MEGLYLFWNEEPLSESSVGRVLGDISVSTRTLPEFKTIRDRDLRHSHATFIINKGANIVTVSKRLRHANFEIILEKYTHLFKEGELK
jgi:site-specific recombinase XerD